MSTKEIRREIKKKIRLKRREIYDIHIKLSTLTGLVNEHPEIANKVAGSISMARAEMMVKNAELTKFKEERYKHRKIKKYRQTHHGINDYNQYINSAEWKKRKKEYYKKNDKRCLICGDKKSLNLHHLDYSNLSKTEDQHLVPLCRCHHKEFHAEYGVSKNMEKEFNLFLKSHQSKFLLTI